MRPDPNRTSSEPRWNAGAVPLSACDIASASWRADRVVLSFGNAVASTVEGSAGQPTPLVEQLVEQRIERLHQVAMAPEVARHFRHMLVRMIADHERRQVPASSAVSPQAQTASTSISPSV